MDEKKLGVPLHQIADALKFQAEFLERCCWFVSGPARSFAEFFLQVLHHSVNQLFFVGKVIEEGSCIDARCFCDFLVRNPSKPLEAMKSMAMVMSCRRRSVAAGFSLDRTR